MKKYSENITPRVTARHKLGIEISGDVENKRILNLGSYNGWYEKFMIEKKCKQIVGIEINDKFINIACKEVKKAIFVKASCDSLPFIKEYFDIVSIFDVLEHLTLDKERVVLQEIRRVLKLGGKLILSVPLWNIFSNLFDPAWYLGHRHLRKEYIINLLINQGFKIKIIKVRGRWHELLSMLLLYIFKWCFRREMIFKNWFDKKREKEYLQDKEGFVSLFIVANKE